MSVAEVAQGLVDLCRQGQFGAAIDKYYSDDIVSVEPVAMPGMEAEQKGIDAIRAKNQWWSENNEVHGLELGGPYVGDSQFAVHFKIETTPKMTGQRTTMIEMGLYTVADGKITREEFFYNTPGA